MMEFYRQCCVLQHLLAIKADFFEVKESLFNVATLVLMFFIINPGHYLCVNNQKHFMLYVT